MRFLAALTLSVFCHGLFAHPANAPTHPVVHPKPYVIPPTFAKIHACEAGKHGWHYGRTGGLGIMPSAWIAAGGLRFSPTASGATIPQQVWIASRLLRIIKQAPPDQSYPAWCDGAW